MRARGFEPKIGDTIRLVKPFADYPIGYYTLYAGNYINTQCGELADGWRYIVGHYKIHPDIVQGMKDHFEPIEESKAYPRTHIAHYVQNLIKSKGLLE